MKCVTIVYNEMSKKKKWNRKRLGFSIILCFCFDRSRPYKEITLDEYLLEIPGLSIRNDNESFFFKYNLDFSYINEKSQI